MSDLIDRQEAVQMAEDIIGKSAGYKAFAILHMLKELPPVEPETAESGSNCKQSSRNADDRTTGDLIDRQAAIEGKMNLLVRCDDDKLRFKDVVPVEYLQNMPSAEPEYTIEMQESDIDEAMKLVRDARVTILPDAEPVRMRGKWIYGENDCQDGWFCSECRFFIPWDYDYYGLNNINFIKDFHVCPYCKAEMVTYTGKNEDTDE